MSEQLHYLEYCVRDAKTDDQAEALLRIIVKGVADAAPVDALIEIGQTLIGIYRRDKRNEAERN